MKIEFALIRSNPFLWATKVVGIDLTDLKNDLEYCKPSGNRVLSRDILVPHGNILSLMNEIKSEEFKISIISLLQKSDCFRYTWNSNIIEKLPNITNIGCMLYSEDIGCGNNLHLDQRQDFASGMIFFEDENNENLATKFYTSYHDKNPYYVSNTIIGSGWMQANTFNAWHFGRNNSNKQRRFIIYNLQLNL